MAQPRNKEDQALKLAEKKYREEKMLRERAENMAELKKYAARNVNSTNPKVLESLANEEFEGYLIMRNSLEKEGAVQELSINGQVFIYPKGKSFRAPKSIIAMLNKYYEVEETSGDKYRIDRDENTVKALSR